MTLLELTGASEWRHEVLRLWQKAIGWALRQYAWTDAREVRRYVRARADELAPLSRREALKNIGA
jgi:3-methyladenine DNA glycosylase AlkD